MALIMPGSVVRIYP